MVHRRVRLGKVLVKLPCTANLVFRTLSLTLLVPRFSLSDSVGTGRRESLGTKLRERDVPVVPKA